MGNNVLCVPLSPEMVFWLYFFLPFLRLIDDKKNAAQRGCDVITVGGADNGTPKFNFVEGYEIVSQRQP